MLVVASVVAVAATGCTADERERASPLIAADDEGSNPLAAVVTAEPGGGLRPGDPVEVRGEGFVPGERVRVELCAAAATAPSASGDLVCDVGELGRGRADAAGAATLVVHPGRVIVDRRGSEVDCAEASAGCHLRMGPLDDERYAGSVPVTFSERLAPAVVPELTVSPDSQLHDGAEVRIDGRRFPVGAEVRLAQCLEEAPCPPARATAIVGPDGSFTTAARVSRLVTADGRMALECAIGRCEIRATVEGPSHTRPPPPATLRFDPESSLPLLPTLAAEPAGQLRDGQSVVVVGERFAPGARLVVRQCDRQGGSCRATGVELEADGGRFVVGLPVARTFDGGAGRVDCATTACSIAVVGTVLLGRMIAPDPVPITFATVDR